MDEAPLAPAAPVASSTEESTTSLDVTWTAPTNTGRPAITSYDIQYKKMSDTSWINGPQDVTGTSTSIGSLTHSTEYQVQVRATNAEGDSPWSPTGAGSTNEPANNAPVFTNDSATLSITETIDDATIQTAANVGTAITATDDDNDTLTYTLEGTDKDKFTIGSTTGQIQTKVGESYNREDKASYAVTVKADDSHGGSDTMAVTINVINITEFSSAEVGPGGTPVVVHFLEQLSTTLPPITAFAVTVGGESATIDSMVHGVRRVQLYLANNIRQGQTATVSYTDPSSGNDANAIQDTSGNDAHSFTDESVTNNSTRTPHRPREPTGLTATADGSTRVDLSWAAPVDNGGRVITGYQIQESPDGRQTGLNVIWNDVVEDTGNSDTTYTETGLAPGTTRYYRVIAINSEGTSNASNVATLTTPTPDGTPSAPQRLMARADGKTQIELSWAAPGYTGDSPVTGYRIEVSTDGGNDWEDLDANTGNTDTAYSHPDLSPSTTRDYRVSATNSAGTGAASNVASATTTAPDTPTEPKNVRAVLSDSQVTLMWDAPDSDGGSPIISYSWRLGYFNHESDTTTFEGWSGSGIDPEGASFEETITQLHNGDTYVFKVRANNVNGLGAESEEVRMALPAVAFAFALVQEELAEEAESPVLPAWLSRFGRTVADQVLDAVEGRMTASRGRTRIISVNNCYTLLLLVSIFIDTVKSAVKNKSAS